jgi:hypothetical protein
LYVDEFQNFSTDSFADILSQARKYRLNLIVANQFTTQLSEEIRDAVFGNVGTVVSYRVGTNDAEFLAKQFAPIFDIDDLQFIPNYNTVARMMIGGVPVQPFSMAALPPLGNPNPQLAAALKQLSAAKYGRPQAQVEAEIFKRLETQAPARPALGSGFGPSANPFGSSFPPAGGAMPPSMAPRPSLPASSPSAAPTGGSGSSFLDEWMAKRKAAGSAGPGATAAPSTASASAMPASFTPPKPFETPKTATPAAKPAEEKPKPELQTEAKVSAPGELKINRDQEPLPQESGVLNIDKDGNISYGS